MKPLVALAFTILAVSASPTPNGNPQLYNPFFNFFKFPIPYYHNAAESYVPVNADSLFKDDTLVSYLSQPNDLPTMNVLTEPPHQIKNEFTVVPMLLVSRENMNFVNNARIMGTSDRKPLMIVKTESNNLLQCTPAVKVDLKNPIIVYSLKTSIVFPSDIEIIYEGYRIPIKVGAVMAPIPQDTFVSTETPVSINVVYAVPTKPVHVDLFNNEGNAISAEDDVHHSGNDNSADSIALDISNGQENEHETPAVKPQSVHHDQSKESNEEEESVVIDSSPIQAPVTPQNVTVMNFPETEGESLLQVTSQVTDGEDAELVNRNPPAVLAPAGIVQSTQPIASVEPFTNSKESSFLQELKDEAYKQRY